MALCDMTLSVAILLPQVVPDGHDDGITAPINPYTALSVPFALLLLSLITMMDSAATIFAPLTICKKEIKDFPISSNCFTKSQLPLLLLLAAV